MANLSNEYESRVLNHLFGRNSTLLSTGANATLYAGLWRSTASLTEAMTATSTGECPGSTYSRVSVANSTAQFTISSGGGTITNKAEWQWTANCGSDWATLGKLVILDSNSTTTGKIITWSTFAPISPTTGQTVKMTTGALTLSCS